MDFILLFFLLMTGKNVETNIFWPSGLWQGAEVTEDTP